jgi:hypothetical protein
VSEDTDKVLANQAKFITQQEAVITSLKLLIEEIAKLEVQMTKLSASIMSIIQVPIAVVLVGVASWAFFFKYISEWTWLMLIAVALFRYLGDSITAVVNLVRRKNGSV